MACPIRVVRPCGAADHAGVTVDPIAPLSTSLDLTDGSTVVLRGIANCAEPGYTEITSRQDCVIAATALGLFVSSDMAVTTCDTDRMPDPTRSNPDQTVEWPIGCSHIVERGGILDLGMDFGLFSS